MLMYGVITMTVTSQKQHFKKKCLVGNNKRYMGICASISETNLSERDSDVTHGDWDSYNEGEMAGNGECFHFGAVQIPS